MITVNNGCLSCRQPLHGRTDKKFCNDYCRNTHHNQLNCDGNKQVRNINHCLRKNRRILESLLQSAKQITKVSKQTLLYKGFSFHYFTHIQTNKKGCRYCFCYEYGYLLNEDEGVVVVRKRTGKYRTDEQGTDE